MAHMTLSPGSTDVASQVIAPTLGSSIARSSIATSPVLVTSNV